MRAPWDVRMSELLRSSWRLRVAMPSLYVEVREDLASIMFDVFGTQRSKQLLQRQRSRIGSLVKVVHVHCAPGFFVRSLDYSAMRGDYNGADEF